MPHLQHRLEGRIGADTVVLSVGEDHAAVEARFAGLAGRDHLQLRRLEVLLSDPVLPGEHRKKRFLHRILFSRLFAFAPGLAVRPDLERHVADDHVQFLSLDHLGSLLLKLFLGKMDQQIGDEKHRIVRILAHIDDHGLPVLLHDYTVDRERHRHILIFLDPSVIVCIEVAEAAVLVHRILFDIKSRGIDVGAENIQSLLHRPLSDLKKNH